LPVKADFVEFIKLFPYICDAWFHLLTECDINKTKVTGLQESFLTKLRA